MVKLCNSVIQEESEENYIPEEQFGKILKISWKKSEKDQTSFTDFKNCLK